MRVVIAAIGKLKDDEERGICERYAKRIASAGKIVGIGPVEFREFSESRAALSAERKREEALRLAKELNDSSYGVVLDPGGDMLSSEEFAAWIGRVRDTSIKSLAFLIGGPDGHGDAIFNAAKTRISLGPLTLPHGLARAVLMEQIYRAVTILSGHPYHRA